MACLAHRSRMRSRLYSIEVLQRSYDEPKECLNISNNPI